MKKSRLIEGIRYKVSCIRLDLGLFSLVLFLSSCGGDDDTIAPKPRAYYRITFPEKQYVLYDSLCPFSFEIADYSIVEDDKGSRSEPCFLNMNFPSFRGTLHISYKEVNDTNLRKFIEDTYTLATKHQVKASGIEEQLIENDSARVYGLLYNIGGNAASSVQFFLTDSTRHFVRGSLYFNAVPNTDSIRPVVDFIRKDIYRMIETFQWKDQAKKVSSIPSK